jgi:hypothetical protein
MSKIKLYSYFSTFVFSSQAWRPTRAILFEATMSGWDSLTSRKPWLFTLIERRTVNQNRSMNAIMEKKLQRNWISILFHYQRIISLKLSKIRHNYMFVAFKSLIMMRKCPRLRWKDVILKLFLFQPQKLLLVENTHFR